MRKYALLAVVAGTVLGGSLAKADFTISSVRAVGNVTGATGGPANVSFVGGSMSGFDAVFFYAHNNGGTTGDKLDSIDVTLKDNTSAGLKIGYANTFVSSADLTGTNTFASNSNVYVFGFGNSGYYSFQQILGDPSPSGAADNNTGNYAPTATNPGNSRTTYGNAIQQFETTGISSNTSGGAGENGVNATTANGNLGALFAVAVVPTGDSVTASGGLFGNAGPQQTFSASNPAVVPEPSSIALVGIGAAGLLLGRRRRV